MIEKVNLYGAILWIKNSGAHLTHSTDAETDERGDILLSRHTNCISVRKGN